MAYSPGFVPNDPKELASFLIAELGKIQDELNNATGKNILFLTVAPAKPREGMLYGADGTHWNPGAGQGIYCYYGGVWTKL